MGQRKITLLYLRKNSSSTAKTMMKTAIALIFVVSGVTAFAPTATVGRTAVSTAAVADLDGMIGVDIETGKKIVSSM